MLKFKDIANQKFGRLTAIDRTGAKRYRVFLWNCICECGANAVIPVNSLTSGLTRSCGCLSSETAKTTQTKHGYYGTRTYVSWGSMIQRCTNPNNTGFEKYGAKGISVCERWMNFENFLADMGERPEDTSLDRYPNCRGNYEKSNCRWATRSEQRINQIRV